MTDAPDPIRAAIEAHLKADATLLAMLPMKAAGIYHRRASQQAKLPVVVHAFRSGTTTWNFDGELVAVDERWLIRAVAFGRMADRGETVGRQIFTTMTDAALVVPGGKAMACYPEQKIQYSEQVGRELFEHCGWVIRITTSTS